MESVVSKLRGREAEKADPIWESDFEELDRPFLFSSMEHASLEPIVPSPPITSDDSERDEFNNELVGKGPAEMGLATRNIYSGEPNITTATLAVKTRLSTMYHVSDGEILFLGEFSTQPLK